MIRYLLSSFAVLLSVIGYSQDVLPDPSSKSPADKKFFYPFEISLKAAVARHDLPYTNRPQGLGIIRLNDTEQGLYIAQESVMATKVSASASVYVSRSVDIGLHYDGGAVPYKSYNMFADQYRVLNMTPWLSRCGVFGRYHYVLGSWDINALAGGGSAFGTNLKGWFLFGGIGVNYQIVGPLYASLQCMYAKNEVTRGHQMADFESISTAIGISFRF